MHTQRINITLPIPILRQIQKTVPSGKRSKFIAESILERLIVTKSIDQELKKSLKKNKPLYGQIIKDWETTELEIWPR